MKLQSLIQLLALSSAHNLYMECTEDKDCLEPGNACCSASDFNDSIIINMCVYYTQLTTPKFVPLFSHLKKEWINLTIYCGEQQVNYAKYKL